MLFAYIIIFTAYKLDTGTEDLYNEGRGIEYDHTGISEAV
jgi:hypothetical protein